MSTERTEREIQADKRELEIKVERDKADKAANFEFNEVTKEEQALFQPALERWRAFYRPYFEALQVKLVANRKVESEALAEVRSHWKKCPRCGALAARYQTFCTDDKCGLNLLSGGEKMLWEHCPTCGGPVLQRNIPFGGVAYVRGGPEHRDE